MIHFRRKASWMLLPLKKSRFSFPLPGWSPVGVTRQGCDEVVRLKSQDPPGLGIRHSCSQLKFMRPWPPSLPAREGRDGFGRQPANGSVSKVTNTADLIHRYWLFLDQPRPHPAMRELCGFERQSR